MVAGTDTGSGAVFPAEYSLFLSYAEKDAALALHIETHLAPLVRQRGLKVRRRGKGQSQGNARAAAAREIEECSMALLLLSPAYLDLDRDPVVKAELAAVQRRADAGALRVVPVLASPCDFEREPWLQSRVVLPRHGQPIRRTDADIDKDLLEVADEIRQLLDAPAPGRDPGGAPSERVGPAAAAREEDLLARPYPSLARVKHPLLLHGRGRATRDVLGWLEKPGFVLCLHAPSGAGKSSFLEAGLAPALRERRRSVTLHSQPYLMNLSTHLLEWLGCSAADLGDDPMRFAQRLRDHLPRGPAPVLILDQFQDVFSYDGGSALPRIGRLLAATATLPGHGGDQTVCRWVLAYRQEAHGAVTDWLANVLGTRAAGDRGAARLPHDLARPELRESYLLPLLGEPPAGVDPLCAKVSVWRAFLAAIQGPLELRDAAGRPRYPWRFEPGEAEKLANAFADNRLARQSSPLTPELQVVLESLLESAPLPDEDGVRWIRVGDDVHASIHDAVHRHFHDRLATAFLPDGAAVPAKADAVRPNAANLKAQALLVLRDIADARAMGRIGLPVAEVNRDLDSSDLLGTLQRRNEVTNAGGLVIQEIGVDGRAYYTLPHDVLVNVIIGVLDHGEEAGRYHLQEGLLDVHRAITRRMEAGARGQSALLDEDLRPQITKLRPSLPWGPGREAWWSSAEERYLRDTRAQRRRRIALNAAAGLAPLALLLVLVSIYVHLRSRSLGPEIRAASSYDAAAGAYAPLAALPGREEEARGEMAAWMIHRSLLEAASGSVENALLWRLRALDLQEDKENRREIAYLISLLPADFQDLPHSDAVDGAVVCPGGDHAVTVSGPSAFSWDFTGEWAVGRPLPHEGITGARCTPGGTRIVTFSGNELKLWDPKTGRPLLSRKGRLSFGELGFDAAGGMLVAWPERVLRFWEAATGRLAGEPIPLPRDRPISVTLAGTTVIVVDAPRGEVALRSTLNPAVPPIVVRHDGLEQTSSSPGGDLLLTVGAGGARLWRTADGRPLGDALPLVGDTDSAAASQRKGGKVAVGPSGRTGRVLLGPGGKLIAHLRADGAIFQDGATGAVKGRFRGVKEVAFSPDGRHVALLGADSVRDWRPAEDRLVDVEEWRPEMLRGAANPAFLSAGLFRLAGKYAVANGDAWKMFRSPEVASGDFLDVRRDDARTVVWLTRTRDRRVRMSRRAPESLFGGGSDAPGEPGNRTRTTDGAQVLVRFHDGDRTSAELWDVASRAVLGPDIDLPPAAPRDNASDPDDGVSMVSSEDHLVVSRFGWFASVSRSTGKVLCEHEGDGVPLLHIAAAAAGNRFATARGRRVRVWDAETCLPIGPDLVQTDQVIDMAMNRTGDRLVVKLFGAKILDDVIRRVELVRKDDSSSAVTALFDHPGSGPGTPGAVVSLAGSLFRADTGAPICAETRARWLDVSGDGRWALSSENGAMQLRDVARGCAPIGPPLSLPNIGPAAFSDQESLVVVVGDGLARIHFVTAGPEGLAVVATREEPDRWESEREPASSGYGIDVPTRDGFLYPFRHARPELAGVTPIAGDAAALLVRWEARLALTFDKFGQIRQEDAPAAKPKKGSPAWYRQGVAP